MSPQDRLYLEPYPLDKLCKELENLTPIMFAAKYGCIDYIENKLILLNEKTKTTVLSMVNSGGLTALHFAARYGQVEAIQTLLKHNAPPVIPSKLGQLPIHSAFNQDNHPKKVTDSFNCLSDYKETFAIPDSNGDTIAHLAAGLGLVEVLRAIESYDKSLLNKKNHQSMTPLLVSVMSNQLDSTKYLLSVADKKITDNKGRNALHYAAMYSTNELLMQLVPHFPIDQTDIEKCSALMFAIKSNDIEKARTLVNAGAYVDHDSTEFLSRINQP